MIEKELEQFDKRKLKNSFTEVNDCKSCRRIKQNIYNKNNPKEYNKDERKKYNRERYLKIKNDPIYKLRHAKSQSVYRKKQRALGVYKLKRGNRTLQYKRWKNKEENKIKRKAHVLVYEAVKAGTLLKKECEVCFSSVSLAHHDDYNKPLEVRWLCPLHHYQHHQSMTG